MGVAAIQPVPGYMDAAYYYAGSLRLASGHGFSELIVWNYLDDPQALPHPSHAYWYPLASIVGAGGMLIAGRTDFDAARIGMVLAASLAPLVVAALAYRLTQNRGLAILAGLLAVFSGFYLPFIVTTDNYGLCMLIGGLFFLLMDRVTLIHSIGLGVLAGLLNLARGDGLLWLPLMLLAVCIPALRGEPAEQRRLRWLRTGLHGALGLLGYLAAMGWWWVRNAGVFGTILPPGADHVLWMTSYNQIYSFAPQAFTPQSWLAGGWQAVMGSRLWAFWQNLGTALAGQGMLLVTPLILIGAWRQRGSFLVRLGLAGWIALLVAESLLFPFASVSGGFFHAGTAFQPLWFALAVSGLTPLTGRQGMRFRILRDPRLHRLVLLIFVIALSALLVKIRVVDSGWNEGEYLYLKAEGVLSEAGASPSDVVMVRNPPAFYVMTGRPAVAVPYGDVGQLLAAARRFQVRFVILEPPGISGSVMHLYDHPEAYPDFEYLGDLDDNRILVLKPSR
jgi:hypothetical protein